MIRHVLKFKDDKDVERWLRTADAAEKIRVKHLIEKVVGKRESNNSRYPISPYYSPSRLASANKFNFTGYRPSLLSELKYF